MISMSEAEMEHEMSWDYIPVNLASESLDRGQAPALTPYTETSLIAAAQQGDLSAFNRLVLAHQDSLYGWVASLVHDHALADDITQRTLLTAYEKLSTFRGGSLRAWLFSIARNRSFDELRNLKRHPTVRLDETIQDDHARSLLSVLPSGEPSPEEVIIQAEQAGWLLELLERLPEPYQQVLELVDLYEMDYREAAQVLALPLGTIKSRVARARLKLREMIAQHRELL